jgi:hypothetical protein
MRNKTLKKQRKQRGGGEETEIHKNIRVELERILEIFTLFPDVRNEYTQDSMFDHKTKGAKLIYALRDIYSSRWMRGSEKAIKRNELVVRIIKLIINEDRISQEQGFGKPENEGFGYNIRVPILIPENLISAMFFAIPARVIHHGSKCLGAVCHAVRTITDDEAFRNLRYITSNINIDAENAERIETFNNIKKWFDDKTNDYIVRNYKLFTTMLTNRMDNNRNIPIENIPKYKEYLVDSIKKFNLLFFISNYFYDTLLYNSDYTNDKYKYDDNYINMLFQTLNQFIHKLYPVTVTNLDENVVKVNTDDSHIKESLNNTNDSINKVLIATENSRGGKNTRRHKSQRKSHKKTNQKPI